MDHPLRSQRSNDPIVRKVGFFTSTESQPSSKQSEPLNPSPVIIPPAHPQRKKESISTDSKPLARPNIVNEDGSQHSDILTAPEETAALVFVSTGAKAEAKSDAITTRTEITVRPISTAAGQSLGPKSPASSTDSLTPTSQATGSKVGTFLENKSTVLKSKTTKAERRALQEAQRAAKSAGIPLKPATKKEAEKKVISIQTTDKKLTVPEKKTAAAVDKRATPLVPEDGQKSAKGTKKVVPDSTPEVRKRVELFKHLPLWSSKSQIPNLETRFLSPESHGIHPAVFEVGMQFLCGDVLGGNARTTAMLTAFRQLFLEYSTPPERTLDRDLMAKINSQVSFLISCRPLAAGMGTAIRALKQKITMCDKLPEADAKVALVQEVDAFLQNKIINAGQEIVELAVQKIREDGDVLLTYSSSNVVESIFKRAYDLGRRFRVVIVDSRPELEGKDFVRRLIRYGISCTYARLNSCSYIMKEVTRVLLGASSVAANGYVTGRVGSAAVGMVAHSQRVPVLVCCETYKFHDKVQLDSITSNELGDPNDLVSVSGKPGLHHLQDWSSNENLQLLNLKYDAMPPDYITMIVCEIGMVPPTSVPAILRENRKEIVSL